MSQAFDIFVSHAHEDNEWCRAFAAQLRQMNLSVWYDEVNLSHGKLVPEIVRVLRTGPAFIVVLSPAAVASPWVWLETGTALAAQDQDKLVRLWDAGSPGLRKAHSPPSRGAVVPKGWQRPGTSIALPGSMAQVLPGGKEPYHRSQPGL